jgi:putative transposase
VSYNPDKHHRRTIRLKGYNYSLAGAYFITICSYHRECLFGAIVDGEMQLNEFGTIVADTYLWLTSQYSYVDSDSWVVMPNHLHGILMLMDDISPNNPRRGGSRTAPTQGVPTTDNSFRNDTKRKSLGRLIGAFKTVSTKQINLIRDTPGITVWQRNYYEHIIRSEESMHHIRQYIHNNPFSWQHDQLHPNNPSKW